MIAPLPSELAPSPEDAVSAVAALGFFFVMLQELRNANVFYIRMPVFWFLNISTGSYTGRSPPPVFRGGVGQVRDYGMDTDTKNLQH